MNHDDVSGYPAPSPEVEGGEVVMRQDGGMEGNNPAEMRMSMPSRAVGFRYCFTKGSRLN